MILAVDIGNTNIVVGVAEKNRICFIERIATNRNKSELEYMISIGAILDTHEIAAATLEGSIISSVVPQVTSRMSMALQRLMGQEPLIVGAGIRTGIVVATDNPAATGADRVTDAVAACAEYPLPIVTIDMGTATTISIIDKDRRLTGGLILPGVRISLNALTQTASQLSGVSLDAPKRVIAKNTREAMQSGIINGTAAMLDGLLDRIEEELGEKVTAVATGGMAGKIVPYTRHAIIHDDNLLLKGLYLLYEMNTQKF